MTKSAVATRKDIDDVLDTIQILAQSVNDHLVEIKEEQKSQRQDIRRILSHLDSIEKQLEISEDERLVVGHQLDRLNKWVEQLADKIDYKLQA